MLDLAPGRPERVRLQSLDISDLGLFDWEGRTAERARKTMRTFLGFRECSVADADKLTADTGRQHTQPHP